MKLSYAIAIFSFIAATCATLPASAVTQQPLNNFANVVTGQANNLGALPVNWQQNSIGMSQLQNIFTQNPNFSQFNIQFPNGANWSVSPQGLQSFYNQYIAQAKNSGFGNNPPALNFSSLPTAASASKNAVTVPISNAVGSMQQQAQQMLDQLNYERYSFLESLPSWLRTTITLICNGFMILWDFAVDEVRSWF